MTTISVIEIPEPVSNQKSTERVTKTFQVKQGYWGTVFATAGILTVGYFVYTKYFKKK